MVLGANTFYFKLKFVRENSIFQVLPYVDRFSWIVDYTQKRGSGVCLGNVTVFQIEDMFKNGKPDIVLKMASVSNTKC